jgi:hypothetical protein
LHGLPNASIVRQNRGILWVKGMPNARYSLRDHSPSGVFENEHIAPGACASQSVIHLKVDAEIPDKVDAEIPDIRSGNP